MARTKDIDETVGYEVVLWDWYSIILDNKEWLWQAKLLGEKWIVSIITLLNEKHTKVVIKHFEYYSKLMSYNVDQIIWKKDNQEVSDYLSALSNKQSNA